MAVYRVPAALSWGGPGSPGVNVWSVRTSAPFEEELGTGLIELDAAVDAIKAFYAAIASDLKQGLTVTLGPDILERGETADASRPAETVSSTASSSASAPAPVMVCVSWRTALRARRGMGRTFIGPLCQTAIDTDGTINPGSLLRIQNAAQQLVDASSGVNAWGVGVWGLEQPGTYDSLGRLIPGQPHVHRDFTGRKVNDKAAVLRSRRD